MPAQPNVPARVSNLALQLAEKESQGLAIQSEISKHVAEFQANLAEVQEQSSLLREQIRIAMEETGTTAYDDEHLHITYIKPGKRFGLDMDKIRLEMPQVIKKYGKFTNVKSSVRIKVKATE